MHSSLFLLACDDTASARDGQREMVWGKRETSGESYVRSANLRVRGVLEVYGRRAAPVTRKMATPASEWRSEMWRTETLKRVAVVSTATVVGVQFTSKRLLVYF